MTNFWHVLTGIYMFKIMCRTAVICLMHLVEMLMFIIFMFYMISHILIIISYNLD